MSEKWDAWNLGGGPTYPHEKVVQFCFRHYPAERRCQTRVLDLGCGSGVHTAFFASEGFQVSGLDISEVGIANTRAKLERSGLQASLRVASADDLDFPAAEFDLVVCIGVLDSAGPSVAKASIAAVSRILRTGGRGLFVFASDRDYRVTGENRLNLHGYTRTEVEDMFRGRFLNTWIDRYVTTYEGDRLEQNDWLVTVQR